MRILFCYEYPAPGQDALVSLLPDHDIVNCSRDSVVDHLEGVDVLVPYTKGAPVQYVVNKPAQLRAGVSRK